MNHGLNAQNIKVNDGPDVKLSSVGWCLMLGCSCAQRGQLEGVFFSSDYLFAMSPFLCFIMGLSAFCDWYFLIILT